MINVIVKQSHIMLKRNFCHCFQRVFYSNTAIAATEPKLKSLKSLAKSDRKRNKKFFNNNFIENLFLNKFEETILEYPEIETLKELTSLQKHCDLAKELLANCTNAEKSISERQSENVVSNLKNLELCGFKLPVQKGGYGFQISEHTFMQEVLSSDLALSKVIGENENLGIDIINLYGDQEQRDKYLPEVSKGESITCFAHIESNEAYTPLNPIAVNTKATLSSDGKRYIISGKKNWVYNASHANLIIFSAKVVSNLDKEEKNNTMLFLIDKNLNGIKIHKPIETMGLKGVDICDVTFNEVDIPINSVLGNISEGDVVIKKIFSLSSINSSVQCLTIMKKLLNTTLNHCLYNKFFNKYKYEQDYYKIVLGNIIAKIYAAESMTYLVTGRMDGFENADLFLESLILKIFSSESLQNVLKNCLEVIGTDLYTKNNDIEQMIHDCRFLTACEYTNNHLRLILSTSGCKHFFSYQKETNFFKRIQTKFETANFHLKENLENIFYIYPKDVLKGYLHLMFEQESKVLEDLVYRLGMYSHYLTRKYKENIYHRQVELCLLADLVIDIYTVVALLGRASRAYCLGVHLQELDRSIAESEILKIRTHFLQTISLIKSNTFASSLEKIGQEFLQYKNYHKNCSLFKGRIVEKKNV